MFENIWTKTILTDKPCWLCLTKYFWMTTCCLNKPTNDSFFRKGFNSRTITNQVFCTSVHFDIFYIASDLLFPGLILFIFPSPMSPPIYLSGHFQLKIHTKFAIDHFCWYNIRSRVYINVRRLSVWLAKFCNSSFPRFLDFLPARSAFRKENVIFLLYRFHNPRKKNHTIPNKTPEE